HFLSTANELVLVAYYFYIHNIYNISLLRRTQMDVYNFIIKEVFVMEEWKIENLNNKTIYTPYLYLLARSAASRFIASLLDAGIQIMRKQEIISLCFTFNYLAYINFLSLNLHHYPAAIYTQVQVTNFFVGSFCCVALPYILILINSHIVIKE
ncbi:hypothetical protein ACJX0J_029938, partial [Zea mays]